MTPTPAQIQQVIEHLDSLGYIVCKKEAVAWRFELKAGEYAFCQQKHYEANRFMLTKANRAAPLYSAAPAYAMRNAAEKGVE